MSRPKTITLPPKKARDTSVQGQDRSQEQQVVSGDVDCEQIRQRAYDKWEEAGCPCCDGVEFWLQAEAELNGETQSVGETSEA